MSDDQRIDLRVRGLDCAEEVALLKRELVPLIGQEERLRFDLLAGKLSVDTSDSSVSRDDLISAVSNAGLSAEQWQDEQPRQTEGTFWTRHHRGVLTTVSGVFALSGLAAQSWIAGFSAGHPAAVPMPAALLYTVAIAAGLAMVLPKAWRSLVKLRPDMNLLMTIAVLGAIVIGEWFEGATVAFLFSLSLLLESWSVGRARKAVASLMDLSPPVAHLRQPDGSVRDVHPRDVATGSSVLVRPAEKIPLDGRVLTGAGSVDQSPITGESVPVAKEEGDEVYAGTINGDGLFEIITTKAAGETTLAQIIKMVRDAQSRRAPAEQWVERFASVYTPAVIVAALVIFLVPTLVFQGDWQIWFYRALVLLVIACPCALVISTPVSVVSALASAARQGVLIKGGVFIELPSQLRAVAIDKTGTLTQGEPAVVDVVPLNGHDDLELLARAGALEQHSNHPLARAVVEEAARREVTFVESESFETIPGKGATGLIDGRPFWLGSHRYLQQRGWDTAEIQQQFDAMQAGGRSVVAVGNEEHVCGFIAFADTVRGDSASVVRELRQAGIEQVVMLTGDNVRTAKSIAEQTGVDEVHAELLPEDKVARIEALVEKYGQVAMVGDGVNDAPALARASIGLAMGAAGSDAAIETADVALMSDDLTKLPWLIRHSRRTLRIIRQNIAFALGVKAIFVLLTLVGYASLWAAIAADMGASLLVIANGLRLLRNHSGTIT